MPEQDSKTYKVLDWIILSLFIIFILSLSNSIFINQIGYFGALLFILVAISAWLFLGRSETITSVPPMITPTPVVSSGG